MHQYLVGNWAAITTAAPTPVATGTAVKTLLQIKPIITGKIVEWGISFDGSAAATPGVVELLHAGTVFATVTTHADAGIAPLGPAVSDAPVASTFLTHGASAGGFTATAEGTITDAEVLDGQLIAPTNQYVKQFPLGKEPVMIAAHSYRIRVTFGTTVNALCYMIVEF